MVQSIGIIETCGTSAAIRAADIMAKSAAVEVVGIGNVGGGRQSVVILGDTGAVQAAISAALAELGNAPTAQVLGSHIIARPEGAFSIESILHTWIRADSLDDDANWLYD